MASASEGPDLSDPGMQRLRSVLAGVDAADLERFDPPADLWGRIAAVVAPARTPGMVVEYRIDADDVVFGAGDGWADFARDNGAPELVDRAPGSTLWSHFDGDEIRDLWRAVVARVRGQGASATVPLRCDGPDVRRWFEMTITPGEDGTVRFRSALVFEEPRPAVPFLDVQTERDVAAPPVPVCSWCGQAHDGSRWMGIEELVSGHRLLEESVVPPIAYGVCPSCRERMSAELLVPAATRDDPA